MADPWVRGEVSDETSFISLNDMMLGLIFLFIIILMAFALNYRTAEHSAERTLDELKQERDLLQAERDRLAIQRDMLEGQRDMLSSLTTRLVDKDGLRTLLLNELQRDLAARGIDVVIDPEKGILRLPVDLLFPSGSAELTQRGSEALGVLAAVLDARLPCYAQAPDEMRGICEGHVEPILETVLVEGHTDSVPLNRAPFEDNWDLSAARGVNTFKALVDVGSGLERLRNERNEALLGVAGYEARRPVAIGDSAAARELNRRIDLRFIVSAPDAEELRELRRRIDGISG
ncbi:MAG: OmpA family protein [Geminicoccaceae bacterium]|nr:OmpA family protein [Geminicoccaceae bacterium]